MLSAFSVLAIGFLFCLLLMAVFWWISQKLSFYSLVDAVWAYGIGALVIIFVWTSKGAAEKKALALILSMLWSLRLGSHLAARLKAHYPLEDSRYIDLKKKWGKAKFFAFFQFQGLSQIVFSLPFFFIANDSDSNFSFLTVCGVIIFFFGFFGETVADHQLSQFKKAPANKNKVCKAGLWKYSRHPNYFFEWLIWCGISISALPSAYGYLGLISPLLMYLTLNYLTGIPKAEEQSLKSKGDLYRDYQKTTNRFFPGIKI